MAERDGEVTPERGHATSSGRGGAAGRAAMLVIGLLAGIAVAAAMGIFLLGIGWAAPRDARAILHPTAAPTPTPVATTVPNAGKGGVPEPCVRSAQYNIEVDKGLDALAKGAQANDALAVQKALDGLQDSRDKAAGAAQQCLALSQGSSASPSPSASPTSTPATPSPAQSSAPRPSTPTPTSRASR